MVFKTIVEKIRNAILWYRCVSLLLTVVICTLTLYWFMIEHSSQFVIVTNFQRFEPHHIWNTFTVLNRLLYHYLSYTALYVHVSVSLILLFVLVIIDYEVGGLWLCCYVIIALFVGCHYEIVNLMSDGSMYLIDLGYIQLELLYDDEILKLEAFRYLAELNTEWGTAYTLDKKQLHEWLMRASGRKSILMGELVVYYIKKHSSRNKYLEKNILFLCFRNTLKLIFGQKK